MITKSSVLYPNKIFFEIFQFLWMKTSEQRHFSFNIPDTVLFLNDKPICWIFTNKEGNVKKKNSEKLNNEEIYKYFVKKSKSDILCSYAYSTDENKKIELIKKNEQEKYSNFEMLKEYFEKLGIDENYDKKSELIINNSLKFEFYDKSQLKSFLNDNVKIIDPNLNIYDQINEPHVIFISYHNKHLYDLQFPAGSIIVDPWRTYVNDAYKVIYYGNTR